MNDNEAVAVMPSSSEYSSMEYASAGVDATNSASEVSVGAVGRGPDDDGLTTALNPDLNSSVNSGYENNPSAVDSSSLGLSQFADYSMSVNGNVVSEAGHYSSAENGAASRDAGLASGVAPEHHVEDGSVLSMSPEEERLWSIVKTNSLDFNAWTSLIEETEKVSEDNIQKIRKVYDAFLAEFPLCYGYWKKYADHEARFGSNDKVMEVYERAVLGVTYSVDIWLHYCTFSINTYGDQETIRRLFERGLAYVGTDYLSYSLWDKYIEYEYSQQEWSRLAMIYTSILESPNQQLDRYFNSFKELASSRPLSELKSSDEAAASLEAAGKMTKGEIGPDAEGQLFNPPSADLTEAQELEKYIAIREEIYKKTKEFDFKIIGFETAIRRPYFHVRPLNVTELENWHNYLDFMEREGDFNKVVKLYERCLIACASYPEYWIRYVKCMEVSGSMDIANNALARATQVFVKRQPEIHLFSAQFKEQNGDILGARGAYQLVHTEISPGLLEAIIKHANMERRMGKLEEAFSLYEQAIAIEKGKEHSQTLPMLFAQYSRFVHLVSGNAEKAREILVEALENVQLSKPLLEALIHLESIQSLPKRIGYLDSLVEKFISPNAESSNEVSGADREEVSCIYLEFLDLFGDAQMVKKAEDRHVKLFVHNRSGSESRKRHAEDLLASDRSKLAKSYPGAVQSVMGTYPATQNQWAAGYGVQPQAWPQVPVQGQQWNAGYTQQAAYGTYTGYGSTYTTPQVPASVPQSAAYSTYPTSYTGQATVAPQSYAQPAAVAAAAVPLAPAPQAASVPQAYYGTYY